MNRLIEWQSCRADRGMASEFLLQVGASLREPERKPEQSKYVLLQIDQEAFQERIGAQQGAVEINHQRHRHAADRSLIGISRHVCARIRGRRTGKRVTGMGIEGRAHSRERREKAVNHFWRTVS